MDPTRRSARGVTAVPATSTGGVPPVPPTSPSPAGRAGVARLPEEYREVRRLGDGRDATVSLCRSEASRDDVAVKVLHVRVPESRLRLALHAEMLSGGAAAAHPCAVRIRDVGFQTDGHPYLASRFCPGGSAQARLVDTGAFAVDDVLVIGVRMALALHTSHRRGVLHLGVRPSNVLFDADDRPLLADHGLSRVLHRAAPERGAVYDPLFSPRELLGWEAPGPAADVYGLGATLYTLLTGVSPNAAGAAGPALPGTPTQLQSLLERMTSRQPGDRPSLKEVHNVLRALLPESHLDRVPDLAPEPEPDVPLPGWDSADDELIDTTPDTPFEAAEAVARRRRRNRILSGAFAFLVVGGLAAALLLPGGEKKDSAKTPAPTPSSLSQVSPERLPLFQAGKIEITVVGGQVQVSWEPPREPVSGYLVTVRAPDGRQADTPRSTAGTTYSVVFDSPPVPPGSCYVVTSLVRDGDRGIQLAPSPPVCQSGRPAG